MCVSLQTAACLSVILLSENICVIELCNARRYFYIMFSSLWKLWFLLFCFILLWDRIWRCSLLLPGSCRLAQDGHEFVILLPQPPRHWDFRPSWKLWVLRPGFMTFSAHILLLCSLVFYCYSSFICYFTGAPLAREFSPPLISLTNLSNWMGLDSLKYN